MGDKEIGAIYTYSVHVNVEVSDMSGDVCKPYPDIEVGLLLVSFVSLDVTFDISDGRLDPSFDTSRRL